MTRKNTLVDHLAVALLGASVDIISKVDGEDITLSEVSEDQFELVTRAIDDYVLSNKGTLRPQLKTNLAHDITYRFEDTLPTSVTSTYSSGTIRVSVRNLV